MNPETTSSHYMDALLKDHKQQRRAVYFKYSLLGFVALVYLGVLTAGVTRVSGSPDGEYTALVRISGEIGPGKPASAEVINPLLERAFADKNAKGVVLLINSPGGTPVQSSLIHDRVQVLKKQYNKKVIAVGEDMMTSGAYMIAVAADELVVNRSTLTGSIGVISRSFGFTGLMDKVGVERRVMTAGESKNMLDPFGPQTEQDRVKTADLLKSIHQHFKDTVTAGRGGRLKLDTPGLFSGMVWTGEDAVDSGLVDKLGDVKSAGKENFGTDKYLVFSPPKSFLDRAMGALGTKVIQELAPRVDTPLAMPN
jgi:protease-4